MPALRLLRLARHAIAPSRWGAALALAAFAAAAQAAPRFGDSLCVNVKFAQGQPMSDLPLLRTLGVSWVRDTIPWFDVETAAGRFDPFPADFQRRLDYYRDNNIGLVMMLAYENRRAYPDTPANPHHSITPEYYGRYAGEIARRLKAHGVRFVMELWNEPHNSLQPRVGGKWNGAPPSPWVDHYLAMVDAATTRIKAVDPAIKVLNDDDMWVIHYHFLERGMNRQVDGLGVHPYTGGGIPERTAVAHDTDWTRPYTVVDRDRSFGSAMRRLYEFGEQKLGRRPEIWLTEWGWGIGEKTALGPLDEDAVATYLPRAFISAAAAGATATCWFSIRDSVDGEMGLTDNSGRRRKAFAAFEGLSRQLGNAEYVCPLPAVASTDTVVQHRHLFRDAQGPLIAAWLAEPAFNGRGRVEYSRPATAPACTGAARSPAPGAA
ncbi:MAG: hypothetical protein REI09_08165, partial [Candidatus Dactylopiibacterium sp.]|nr:hypothetical protein [Candidatus Dactylopiibacterium sp.]